MERGPGTPQTVVSSTSGTEVTIVRGFAQHPLDPVARRPAVPQLSLPRDSVYRRALGVADCVAASASLIVLSMVGDTPITPANLLALPFAVFLAKLLGLYDREGSVLWSTTLDEAPRVLAMALIYTVAIWLAAGSLLPGHVHKGQFILAWATMLLGSLAARMAARRMAETLTPRERCLVLGPASAFERVRRRLSFGEAGAAEVVLGIPLEPGGFQQLLSDGILGEVVGEYGIDRIVIASTGHDTDDVLELVRAAGGLGVKISMLPDFWDTLGSLVVDEMPGTAMLALRRIGLSRSSELIKRAFDRTLAGAVLLLTGPLLLGIAVLVRVTSPGPALFRQRRIGRHGESFEMLKFRTMWLGAEAKRDELAALNQSVGLFKIRDDPRITAVGHWLRHTCLDELPQLINVLRGDMSLVGPRPLVPEEDETIVGWGRRRLEVLPGITGHWQVLGGPRLSLEEMVIIDYLYIANWSLWRDIKCLLRTASCVLARRGI